MMVTGASGFLGRHLVEASEAGGWELLAPGSQAFDIRRNEHVQDEIRTWKPNAVVHLAYRPDDRRVIVDGSRHVAAAAAAVGARLVHMSTDMVFAGRAEPYTEADAPDATLDAAVPDAVSDVPEIEIDTETDADADADAWGSGSPPQAITGTIARRPGDARFIAPLYRRTARPAGSL